MFKALAELAQKSTLLISIATDGDQLRVNITPKANAAGGTPALRPLSLLATADELDQDFGKALLAWTSPPRRSLLDQVADATAEDAAEEGNSAAAKGSAKPAKPAKTAKAPAKSADKSAAPVAADAQQNGTGNADSSSTGNTESSSTADTDSAAASQTATDSQTPATPGQHGTPATATRTDALPGNTDSSSTVNSDAISSSTLDKDWQIPPASNQPPPVPNTASTPTPAAPPAGAFLEVF